MCGVIFKKSKLKTVMLGLIKDLKTKYGIQVRYAKCNNAQKTRILNGFANRKGLVLNLSILLQVLLNRMAVWNRNLPPSSIRFMSCSTVRNFLPS